MTSSSQDYELRVTRPLVVPDDPQARPPRTDRGFGMIIVRERVAAMLKLVSDLAATIPLLKFLVT